MLTIIACIGQLCITEIKPVGPVTLVGTSCVIAAPQIIRTFEDSNPDWSIKEWYCGEKKSNGR